MITSPDLLRLSYTRDLTEGGIAYALHALQHAYGYPRMGGSAYDHLRRAVAGAAVELAFRRYLSQNGVPFEIKGAAPFTEPDRYDVTLGGRRCEIQTFLISHRDPIAQIQRDHQVLFRAPARVASDQHAAARHSPHDLYLFAFLLGHMATSPHELQTAVEAKKPYFLVHVMPDAWKRPSKWVPLGRLALKSDSDEPLLVELGGQDEGRALRSCSLELPPRARVETETRLFSLAYIHARSSPGGRIGIHSPVRRETHVIGASDWGNIWLDGLDIILAGYLSHEEFSRRASFVPAGSQVSQYDPMHEKNLVVPLSDLRPLAELFERVRTWKE